jgi:hypothetical protein
MGISRSRSITWGAGWLGGLFYVDDGDINRRHTHLSLIALLIGDRRYTGAVGSLIVSFICVYTYCSNYCLCEIVNLAAHDVSPFVLSFVVLRVLHRVLSRVFFSVQCSAVSMEGL